MSDKHKLGLPLEYQQMPEYFDAHNMSKETEAKNAVIEKLLKDQKVKTVLDMTCGTGSQVFYLAEHGYEVVGSDFSPALIEIARKKANKAGKNITFIDGDVRELHVEKFDAVITIFNAIGHLTKADFEKALQNIHVNLKNSGVYIFDIFNLQVITDDIIDNFAMDIESVVNGVKIRNVQHSEIDRKNGLLTCYDHYTILKDSVEPEIHTNTFSLQIYTAKELQAMRICSRYTSVLIVFQLMDSHLTLDEAAPINGVAIVVICFSSCYRFHKFSCVEHSLDVSAFSCQIIFQSVFIPLQYDICFFQHPFTT